MDENHICRAACLDHASHPAHPNAAPQGAVVVTGGLGMIGSLVGGWLARQQVADVLLLGAGGAARLTEFCSGSAAVPSAGRRANTAPLRAERWVPLQFQGQDQLQRWGGHRWRPGSEDHGRQVRPRFTCHAGLGRSAQLMAACSCLARVAEAGSPGQDYFVMSLSVAATPGSNLATWTLMARMTESCARWTSMIL